jgi:hypothetical protein
MIAMGVPPLVKKAGRSDGYSQDTYLQGLVTERKKLI